MNLLNFVYRENFEPLVVELVVAVDVRTLEESTTHDGLESSHVSPVEGVSSFVLAENLTEIFGDVLEVRIRFFSPNWSGGEILAMVFLRTLPDITQLATLDGEFEEFARLSITTSLAESFTEFDGIIRELVP